MASHATAEPYRDEARPSSSWGATARRRWRAATIPRRCRVRSGRSAGSRTRGWRRASRRARASGRQSRGWRASPRLGRIGGARRGSPS